MNTAIEEYLESLALPKVNCPIQLGFTLKGITELSLGGHDIIFEQIEGNLFRLKSTNPAIEACLIDQLCATPPTEPDLTDVRSCGWIESMIGSQSCLVVIDANGRKRIPIAANAVEAIQAVLDRHRTDPTRDLQKDVDAALFYL